MSWRVARDSGNDGVGRKIVRTRGRSANSQQLSAKLLGTYIRAFQHSSNDDKGNWGKASCHADPVSTHVQCITARRDIMTGDTCDSTR